ncbi:MAG: Gfo/Idh/MocA family oxidoreductase [Proteobacteria bacterium]|nr:Gfo/Idh/MocA family oxidoreductase [Pseudomonadota bacterium]
MRVAVVGLGSIAQKAYLPVLTTLEGIDLVLCSRDSGRLSQLAARCRVRELTQHLSDLSTMRIDAAFVHAATEAHEDIVGFLLKQGIPVYVDKPLAYTLEASNRLVDLCESSRSLLMVGFNRRHAPMYRQLADQPQRRMVLMQKHRRFSPDTPRHVVFDDFVHVVDTLRFLAPGPIRDVRTEGLVREGKLHHVLVQLSGDGFQLVGSMNRDSGAAEEVLEVMSPSNKWMVRNMIETTHWHAGTERVTRFDDWESVLQRRGFPQIIRQFLDHVTAGYAESTLAQDALQTHALCEQIVGALQVGV